VSIRIPSVQPAAPAAPAACSLDDLGKQPEGLATDVKALMRAIKRANPAKAKAKQGILSGAISVSGAITMKVSVSTYGGQVATFNLNRPPHVVDSADLGQEGKDELRRLGTAATQASEKSRSTASSYAITIADDGKSEVLEATDGSVSAELAELRNFMRKHQRPWLAQRCCLSTSSAVRSPRSGCGPARRSRAKPCAVCSRARRGGSRHRAEPLVAPHPERASRPTGFPPVVAQAGDDITAMGLSVVGRQAPERRWVPTVRQRLGSVKRRLAGLSYPLAG
jgi:hypothetical protein